ncbi:hypothetical protein C8035_v009750 [Colletotrichum spinosum]|uniref:F-box domain-containing protein n=1 Tax=Colletotrichum spinosum TaxID=1347390 RepID=A0A4R8QD71_9PEZI|nr:hypothetical protein C8035_v009750 [Colletotrichum spinosum]
MRSSAAQTTAHTLLNLPADIITNILLHADTPKQLLHAIQSHRVFYNVWRNDPFMLRKVVENRIGHDLLPYAAALLESKSLRPGIEHDAVRSLLARLDANVRSGGGCNIRDYRQSDYADMLRTHFTVEILREEVAAEALVAFVREFRLGHPQRASKQENFRIRRALYRFQLMCDLFYVPVKSGTPLYKREIARLFFYRYSPWVNEQMLCVYSYLERKVSEAFDHVAAHNVEWGEMPLSWSGNWCAEDICQIQWNLSRGLDFLVALFRAKTYDERNSMLPMYPPDGVDSDERNPFNVLSYQLTVPFETFIKLYPEKYLSLDILDPDIDVDLATLPEEDLRVVDDETGPMEPTIADFEQRGFLEKLSQPADGSQDSPLSTPFRLWCRAHAEKHLMDMDVRSIRYNGHVNLLACGYVFWDCDLPQPHDQTSAWDTAMTDRMKALAGAAYMFPRLETTWERENILRSEKQRSSICLAGGSGYWPKPEPGKDYDFSRVRGLSEEEKQRLVERFRMEEAKGIGHVWGGLDTSYGSRA